MIFAATQSLAEFLTNVLPMIEKESISFEHPQVLRSYQPLSAHKTGLNLYCYHIQESRCFDHEPIEDVTTEDANSDQWFELTFLVSISDHTVLGEQHLLSNVVELLSNHQFLPEQVVAPELRGLGPLPICIVYPAIGDTIALWQVLQAPLRLSIQIKLTVPIRRRSWALYP